MENQTTVFGGATQEAPRLDRASLPDDLIFKGMPPVNLLLTGGDVVVQSVLETLLSNHDQSIACWWPGQRLVLPAMQRPAMMILHDVGALGAEDQLQLLRWLERDIGRTKVVSTTPAPLMPLVEKGAFNDTLYYRLNTVSVQISD